MTLEVVYELQANYEGIAYVYESALFYFWWADMGLDFLTINRCFGQFYQLEKVLADPLVKSLVRDIQKHILWEFRKAFFPILYLHLYVAQAMFLGSPVCL